MSPLSNVPDFDCFCAERVIARDHFGKPTRTVPDSSLCPLHRKDGLVPTVRLTPHARERCEEMGITTKRVKHALRHENRGMSMPDPDRRNTLVWSNAEPGLMFCVAGTDPDLVVTVMWRSNDPIKRSDGPPPEFTG